MVQSHRIMLSARQHVLLALLASGVAALAAAQGTGTLPAGQTLSQGQALSSSDGRVSLTMQTDGNLVLYSVQVANLFGQSFASAIFATATYGATPGPFSLVMQQNCNLVLLNGNGQTIYSSGTANQGTAPCQLVVSGAGGGGFAVVDSKNATLYSQGAYSPPGTLPGTLPAGAMLTQDTKLFSLDGSVCLIAQSDGNVVLYNVALLAQLGSATAAAAVWDSNTTSSSPRPYRLLMQADCNLVFYNANGLTQSSAIYYSATYNQGALPCHLTVSGLGGGFISVSDATYKALFVQPPTFQVLLDGPEGSNPTSPPTVQYQAYDANSNAASRTTQSPTLATTSAKTLLPTTNTILAFGSTNNLNAPAAEVFNPRTSTWTSTGAPSTGGGSEGLITLFDGTALSVGGPVSAVSACEIYSPATNAWAPTGSLNLARTNVALAPLLSGNVLTAGGSNASDNTPFASAEVFDVKARKWTAVGPMATNRSGHQLTTLLDGRVLATGGIIAVTPSIMVTPTASAELFNPATSSFSGAAPMHVPRYFHRATLLASGRVLVAGGFINNPFQAPTPPCTGSTVCTPEVITNSTEIFDPATGAWTMGPSMPYNRAEHDQLLLPNGRTLIAGGPGNKDFPNLNAMNFGPAYSTSLLYDEVQNAFVGLRSLPLEDVNDDAVLFRV